MFIKKLEKIRDRIGRERDALREMQAEIESLFDACEQGGQLLDDCIETFSQSA